MPHDRKPELNHRLTSDESAKTFFSEMREGDSRLVRAYQQELFSWRRMMIFCDWVLRKFDEHGTCNRELTARIEKLEKQLLQNK